jgi:hypothetical protein
MHHDMTFDRTTEAKGRNRWFVLDRGEIVVGTAHSWLELCSKRAPKNAPIILRFANPADMQRLGEGLLKAAAQWATARDNPHGTEDEALSDADYIALARTEYHEEGAIEIDDNAVVSRGSEPGAYVAAWLWVDTPIDEEETA